MTRESLEPISAVHRTEDLDANLVLMQERTKLPAAQTFNIRLAPPLPALYKLHCPICRASWSALTPDDTCLQGHVMLPGPPTAASITKARTP